MGSIQAGVLALSIGVSVVGPWAGFTRILSDGGRVCRVFILKDTGSSPTSQWG